MVRRRNEHLRDKNKRLISQVEQDSFTDYVCEAYEINFNGTSEFKVWEKPKIAEDFKIGLIIGPSGSGKTSLLREFGQEEHFEWERNKAVVSHFDNPTEAVDRLNAVGLSSIPSLLRPYHVLSNGEQFRARLARALKSNAVIDEYTSVVDRNVARAVSVSIYKYITTREMRNIVFASCHYDIIEWLQPDWVFDCADGSYHFGRWLQKPEIKVDIFEGGRSLWSLFKKHHYMTGDLHAAARCYLAFWRDELIGFESVIYQPGVGKDGKKNTYREHRLVILPDYQGLGIGARLSDCIGQSLVDEGKRFFARSSHMKLGMYRDRRPDLWRKTSSYGTISGKHGGQKNFKWWKTADRICYSHEYIGKKTNDNENSDNKVTKKRRGFFDE